MGFLIFQKNDIDKLRSAFLSLDSQNLGQGSATGSPVANYCLVSLITKPNKHVITAK